MKKLILALFVLVAIGIGLFQVASATSPGVGLSGPVGQIGIATTPVPSTDPGAGQCNGSGLTRGAVVGICATIAETTTHSAATPMAFSGHGPLTFNASSIATSTDAFQFKNAGTCTAANKIFSALASGTQLLLNCGGQLSINGNDIAFSGTGEVDETVSTATSTDAFSFANSGTCTTTNNIVAMINGSTNEFTVTCAGSAAPKEHLANTGAQCTASGANFHNVCAVPVTSATTTGTVTLSASYSTAPSCRANGSFNTGAIWFSTNSGASVVVTWATSGTGTIYIACYGNAK